MTARWIALGLLLAVPVARADTAPAPDRFALAPRTTARPPLEADAVFEQVVGGLAGGALGALVGSATGIALERIAGCEGDDFCGTSGVVVGGGLGYLLGAPAGVAWLGTDEEQTGSFGAALLGAVGGSAVSALLASGIDAIGERNHVQRGIALGVLLSGPVLGATIGFALTRRYRGPDPARGLVPTVAVGGEQPLLGVAGRF